MTYSFTIHSRKHANQNTVRFATLCSTENVIIIEWKLSKITDTMDDFNGQFSVEDSKRFGYGSLDPRPPTEVFLDWTPEDPPTPSEPALQRFVDPELALR